MIDEMESIYQQIADSAADQLPEGWRSARIDAVFFSGNSDYAGEYSMSSGGDRDFEITMEIIRAFKLLRRRFTEAGKPVWGQASFDLQSDGKFKMTFGYDNCDDGGDTIWDKQKWHRHQEERRRRLS